MSRKLTLVFLISLFALLCIHNSYEPIGIPTIPMEPIPIPPPIVEPPPEKKEVLPSFVETPILRERNWGGKIYSDIMNRTPTMVTEYDKDTNAHESVHMINAWLTNKHQKSPRVHGLYGLNGNGIIVEEPPIKKRDIARYIPEPLRFYRYSTYITGQQEWDGEPLYICNEWIAYVSGGKVAIEAVQNQEKVEWQDSVSGSLEFSIYGIALAMAVQDLANDYWQSNKQFKDFMLWNLRRSYETYKMGREMKEFRWDKQDALYEAFLTSPAAAEMRDFVAKNFEGVWLDKDLAKPVAYEEWHRGKEIRLNLTQPLRKTYP